MPLPEGSVGLGFGRRVNRARTARVALADKLRFGGEFAMLLRGVKEGAGPGSPGEREVGS